MTERRSLYAEHPDYRVDLEPSDRRVRVYVDDTCVVDTTRALIVRETRHDPVTYVPFEDVRAEAVEQTAHTTFCPFKGDARYWTLRVGDRVHENLLWGYPEPFEEVAGLSGFVAFYPDRSRIERGDPGAA